MTHTSGNPLLDLHRRRGGSAAGRDEAIARYGFAVPTDEAVRLVAAHGAGGVVEVGAGTGYWARLLADRGVDVVAYDPHPPPSPASRWFAGVEPFHPVLPGDHGAAERHPDRTLLLVWPTRTSTWPSEAVERFRRAGGTRLAFVGEGPGGRTGDDRFHRLLGALPRCQACTYGVTGAACTCGVPVLWRRTRTAELPHWPGQDDRLELYEAAAEPAPEAARPWWRRRPTGRRRR